VWRNRYRTNERTLGMGNLCININAGKMIATGRCAYYMRLPVVRTSNSLCVRREVAALKRSARSQQSSRRSDCDQTIARLSLRCRSIVWAVWLTHHQGRPVCGAGLPGKMLEWRVRRQWSRISWRDGRECC